jgi:hypothetical protein
MTSHEEMERNLDSWNFSARQREAVRALIAEYREVVTRLEAIEEDVVAVADGEPPKVSIYRQAMQLRKFWPSDRMPGDAVPNPDRKKQAKVTKVDPQAFIDAWRIGGSVRQRAASLGMSRRRAVRMAKSLGLEAGSEG